VTVGQAPAPQPALAIPEAEAVKKLSVIPVFLITNDQGVPLPIPRDKTLILPLYLERSQADRELANFNKANPQLKAQVLAIPLNVATEKVEELNKQLKDGRTLVAPIVSRDQDRAQAIAILKKQGLSNKQIQKGLNTPVFFTKPFLTIDTPEGKRGVFFFHYDQLQKALAGTPKSENLEPRAADLTAALREVIKAADDVFVFYPTPDYFDIVKRQGNSENTTKLPEERLTKHEPLNQGNPGPLRSAEIPIQEHNPLIRNERMSTLGYTAESLPSSDPIKLNESSIAQIARSITLRIEGATQGSGVMIQKNNTTYKFLTAWHVLADQKKGEGLVVITPDGKQHFLDFTSIKRVKKYDLAEAAFKSNESYKVANVGKPRNVDIGSQVFVSGFALPSRAVNSRPMRFLKGDIIAISTEPIEKGYQLLYSNQTLPGMSGGPILNINAELIGIHGQGEADSVKITEQDNVYVKTGANQGIPIEFYFPIK